MQSKPAQTLPFLVYILATVLLSAYFAYAAVRGDLGVFGRLVIDTQTSNLMADKAQLETEIAALANRTRRLSDTYLDLDLLDERARSVLGMMRADELVLYESAVTAR